MTEIAKRAGRPLRPLPDTGLPPMTLEEAAVCWCPLVRAQAKYQRAYETGELTCPPERLAALTEVWERNRVMAQVHQARLSPAPAAA